MTKTQLATTQVTRWRGGQHPTLALLKQNLENDGLRPFKWQHKANYRYGVRSHGFGKSIYCVEGGIEIFFPDIQQTVSLRPGDRIDIAAGVRHGITIGVYGATCLEGTPVVNRRRGFPQ